MNTLGMSTWPVGKGPFRVRALPTSEGGKGEPGLRQEMEKEYHKERCCDIGKKMETGKVSLFT